MVSPQCAAGAPWTARDSSPPSTAKLAEPSPHQRAVHSAAALVTRSWCRHKWRGEKAVTSHRTPRGCAHNAPQAPSAPTLEAQTTSNRRTWIAFLPVFWIGLGSGWAKPFRSTARARTSYLPGARPSSEADHDTML